MVKKILLGLLVLFVALQFVRPAKNLLPSGPTKDDFLVRHPPPPEIKRLLEVGCYDCHSNHTRYPWYAEVQPLGWWLADHVADGKASLNLSEYGQLSARNQSRAIYGMIDQIEMRQMPLKSYTVTHRDAIYTDEQIDTIITWLEEAAEAAEAAEDAAEDN